MLKLRRMNLAALLLAVSLGANAALLESNLQTAGDGLITIDTATGLEWLDFDQMRMNSNWTGGTYDPDETVGDFMARVTSSGYVTEQGFRLATAAEVATLFQNAHFLDPGVSAGYPNNPDLNFVNGSWSSAVMLGAEKQCWNDSNNSQLAGCEWQVTGLHAGANAGEWHYSQFDCSAIGEDPAAYSWNEAWDFCPRLNGGQPLYSLGNTVSPDQLGSSLIDVRSLGQGGHLDPAGVYLVRAAVVPLPAAVWFFSAGLGMLGGMGWWRKRGSTG